MTTTFVSPSQGKLWVLLGTFLSTGFFSGCRSPLSVQETQDERSHSALTTSSAELDLQARTSACVANQVLDFFQVTNKGTTPIKVSDITIKFWAYDTSAPDLVGQVNYGGCLNNATGCYHQVSGVTMNATRFSPACGPDPNLQANWEITVSSNDTTLLPAGAVWANIQTAVHLANYPNFSPGPASWYSPCLDGSAYVNSSRFAVYVGGNLVTASTGVPPSCRAPHGTQSLSGQIPPGVGDKTLIGSLPSATPMKIGISLAPRNLVEMRAALDQMYDPNSPQYQQFITPEQFADAYGATQSDYDTVVSFLQSNGLTLDRSYASRDFIAATGTAAAVERAFFVTLNRYRGPDDTTFYAPANEPSLNLSVPVLHISGLHNAGKFASAAGGSGPQGCHPNLTDGAYAGNDFRNIYASGAQQLDGNGEIVGLVQFSDYYDQDLASYKEAFSVAAQQPSPVRVEVGGTPPTLDQTADLPCDALESLSPPLALSTSYEAPVHCRKGSPYYVTHLMNESETALDVEMVTAMAPRAEIRLYICDPEKSSVEFCAIAVLKAMANEPSATRPSVISSSWGWRTLVPDPHTAYVFMQFAMQGQSFFQASGDFGAYTWDGETGYVALDSPLIDSSFMTVVGGTQLTTDDNGAWASETTWNLSAEHAKAATGGGPAKGFRFCGSSDDPVNYYPRSLSNGAGTYCATGAFPTLPIPNYQINMPSYLRAAAVARGELSSDTRMLPDVSLVAAQIVAMYGVLYGDLNGAPIWRMAEPVEACTSGTSASAPLMAGLAALANQQRRGMQRPPLGFANPTIYQAASAGPTAYANAFHDVTVGDNFYNRPGNQSPWGFHAVAGYDMATGLGTPRDLLGILAGGTQGVATSLAAGDSHTCAVKTQGTNSVAVCWGRNNQGQLGNGSTTNSNYGQSVQGLTNVAQIAAGGYHTCAVTTAGTVYCWGGNDKGQLGTGNNTMRTTPVQVPGLSNVVRVIAGYQHTCAIVGTSPAALRCWGANGNGQLGNGNTTDQTSPVSVPLASTPAQVALGQAHSCALLIDNTVWCWGANAHGQLGIGSTTEQHVPTQVDYSSSATPDILTAGLNHTCLNLFISAEGTMIRCWGSNQQGQTGANRPPGTDSLVPETVYVWGATPRGYGALAAGGNHTCAIMTIGSSGQPMNPLLGCWGENTAGQLGIGNLDSPSFGVNQIFSFTTLTNLVLGRNSSYVMGPAGTIVAWGNNAYGQLGDHTNLMSLIPEIVNP